MRCVSLQNLRFQPQPKWGWCWSSDFSVRPIPSLDSVDGDSPSGSAAGASGGRPLELLENILLCFGVTFYLSLRRW